MALAVWRLRAGDQMGVTNQQVHAQPANLGLRGTRPLRSGDAFHKVVDGAHDVDFMDRCVRAGLEVRLGARDAVGESHGVGHLVGNGGVFKEHVGEQQGGRLVAGARPEGELIDLAIPRQRMVWRVGALRSLRLGLEGQRGACEESKGNGRWEA